MSKQTEDQRESLDQILEALVFNDDAELNWIVTVYSTKKSIACFQCRTQEDSKKAALVIKKDRAERGLPTAHASCCQIISGRGKNRLIGPRMPIELD